MCVVCVCVFCVCVCVVCVCVCVYKRCNYIHIKSFSTPNSALPQL